MAETIGASADTAPGSSRTATNNIPMAMNNTIGGPAVSNPRYNDRSACSYSTPASRAGTIGAARPNARTIGTTGVNSAYQGVVPRRDRTDTRQASSRTVPANASIGTPGGGATPVRVNVRWTRPCRAATAR
jgi:hypothetical protein